MRLFHSNWWRVLAGVAALALLGTACVSQRGAQTEVPLTRYEYQQPQMGLPFRLVFYAPERAAADAAAAAAFARIARLNDLLSDYEFDSELSTLSRTAGEGKVVPLSEELWTVLSRAQSLAPEVRELVVFQRQPNFIVP